MTIKTPDQFDELDQILAGSFDKSVDKSGKLPPKGIRKRRKRLVVEGFTKEQLEAILKSRADDPETVIDELKRATEELKEKELEEAAKQVQDSQTRNWTDSNPPAEGADKPATDNQDSGSW